MRCFISIISILLASCGVSSGLNVLSSDYIVIPYARYSAARHTYSMVFDDSGNMYLDQPYDSKIWKVASDGTLGVFANVASSGFDWTGGTVFGNYLYVAAGNNVKKYAPDGSSSTFATGLPATSEAAVDRTGNYGGDLYISTGGQDHIYRVDTLGNVSLFSNWPGWTDGGGPIGMEFDTIGNYGGQMYVATVFGQSNSDKSGLFVLDTAGNASRFSNDLVLGLEIAFDTIGLFDGNMYVVASDAYGAEYSIWKVFPDGTAESFATTTSSTIGSLVFGPDGAMYVAEYDASAQEVTVTKIIPEPATLTLLALGGFGLLRKRRHN